MLKGNCLVGQSGGPTSVINATLAGVIKSAINAEQIEKVYGMVHGIEGVSKENIIDLTNRFSDPSELDLLIHTPAAFLGSCRHRLPNENDPIYKKIFDFFIENNIRYFFYIGGNDSMDTVDKLSKYAKKFEYDINIIGIPKTIDNDLAVTDHSPGFGSAAKYIATTVREIARDSRVYDKNMVTIVEIMGRNAGWLTAASVLARNEQETAPQLIYLPEYEFSIDGFLNDIEEISKKEKQVVVAVSEGVKTSDGNYVCDSAILGPSDSFGHKTLTGTANFLSRIVAEKTGAKVRGIELSLMQRCASHLASATDLTEANAIGSKGVEIALNGGSGKMVYFNRIQNNPYKIIIEAADVSAVANIEKKVPTNWIDSKGQHVSPELVEYLLPLIQGETNVNYQNGLPSFAIR